MEEKLVCEAGFIWRRVLRRLESRVNALLATGWSLCPLDNRYQMKEGSPLCLWGIYEDGWLRRQYIVKLVRAKHAG